MLISKMQSYRDTILGAIMLLVPLLFILGFASHPNLQSLTVMNDASDWVKEIRHNEHLQVAHLFVFLAAGILIYIALGIKSLLNSKSHMHAVIGLFLVIFGSIALAADKGALSFVPSAFDTLDDSQYQQLLPGLQTMLDKKGLLFIVNLIILLPTGFIVLSVGMLKVKLFSAWQPIVLILAMLLFMNPDIDLISLIASVLLLISMGGMGITLIRRQRMIHSANSEDCEEGI